jgi:hypothetical protein
MFVRARCPDAFQPYVTLPSAPRRESALVMVRVLVPPEHLHKLLIVRDHLRRRIARKLRDAPSASRASAFSHSRPLLRCASTRNPAADGMAAPAAPRKRTNARCCGPQCRRDLVYSLVSFVCLCICLLGCPSARPSVRSLVLLLACLFVCFLCACLFLCLLCACLFVCMFRLFAFGYILGRCCFASVHARSSGSSLGSAET